MEIKHLKEDMKEMNQQKMYNLEKIIKTNIFIKKKKVFSSQIFSLIANIER